LAPIPSLMSGDSTGTTLEPEIDGSNFGAWLSGLLARYPAAYSHIERYLREVMPDFGDIQQAPLGPDVNRMTVSFQRDQASMKIPFKMLSDGEKCFLLAAVVLAANKAYGPLCCFWDEPDNYLSLSEVGQFITYLRKAFGGSGQLLATSHNPEAIRKFSDENTFLLHRHSHLEPTLVRRLDELSIPGDLVEALIRGDVIP
jgi:predicted ATPase